MQKECTKPQVKEPFKCISAKPTSQMFNKNYKIEWRNIKDGSDPGAGFLQTICDFSDIIKMGVLNVIDSKNNVSMSPQLSIMYERNQIVCEIEENKKKKNEMQ